MTAENISKATVQKPAPEFEAVALVQGQFKTLSLSQFKGKWVYLFFYPLDFTFVCPTEILAFNDAYDQFKALGVELVACSTDSEYSHLAWVNTPRTEGGLGKDLKLPILADKTMKIAQDYGVLIPNEGITLRGSFIIDPKGILRQLSINDLPVGRSVEETVRLIKAFQFTDKHGEVCPANWDPSKNSKTMVADPTKSKEYFKAVNA